MNGLQILGTGRALPEHVVTNDDLAKIVDTSDEWIVSRTGIKERRFAREGENLTQFAVEAARQAIARAGIRPEDLPRVFEKGFTGYNGREDKKSTGIGLYLCRRVMDQLNHGISLVSRPGQGTLVRLDLSRSQRVVE